MYTLTALVGSFAALWLLLAWLACGFFSGHLAGEKNRCGLCWFLLGVAFGPLALIAAAGLPDNRKVSAVYAEQNEGQSPESSEIVGYQARKAIKDPPVWIGLTVLVVVLYIAFSYGR